MPSKFNWASPRREGPSDLSHISMKPLAFEKIPHLIRGFYKVKLSNQPIQVEYRKDEALEDFGLKWMRLKIDSKKNQSPKNITTDDVLSSPLLPCAEKSVVNRKFSLKFCQTPEYSEIQLNEFMKIIPFEIRRRLGLQI